MARRVRAPAVAGLFYPADPVELRRQVNDLLAAAPAKFHGRPAALVVPHAGYVFSGELAAAAYRQLSGVRDLIRRVAVVGPAHRVYLEGMALSSAQAFATPLGEIPVDRAAVAALCRHPGVTVSDAAHRHEHCLEVQLPFLQKMLGDFSLVPVLVGRSDAAVVARVLDALWEDPSTLLVISTDLSHYLGYGEAQRIDERTCARILGRRDDLSGDEACGARVLNGLGRSRRARSLEIELLGRCNSGDTAGDRNRVVGYGAFVLH